MTTSSRLLLKLLSPDSHSAIFFNFIKPIKIIYQYDYNVGIIDITCKYALENNIYIFITKRKSILLDYNNYYRVIVDVFTPKYFYTLMYLCTFLIRILSNFDRISVILWFDRSFTIFQISYYICNLFLFFDNDIPYGAYFQVLFDYNTRCDQNKI